MIVNTINKISILLIGLLASLIVILLLILNYLPNLNYFEYFLIALFFILVLVYFTNKVLGGFVLNKILPIYKAIGGVNKGILLNNENEQFIIGIIENELRDWAKTKNLEIEDLKSKEEFRKEFLGNVSHELKTPVFNIQGYILTLIDGGINDKDINVKFLNRTEKSVNRLISLIEDLDTISKLESNILELNYTDFNIADTIDDIIESLEIKAAKRNISLTLNKPENIRLVNADKYRINIVLTNLILNSISYGNENGETVISIIQDNINTIIKVSDNGLGIPQVDIPRLFERFYRVDKSRSREFGGTGIGLAIVKHIIEAHKQKVTVTSEFGKGSAFEITLNNQK